jgi:DNA-binding MarR family transcriptional regulator
MADDFDLERMLSYRISKLYHRSYAAAARDIAGKGLALREWRVMALLGPGRKMRASDLVDRSLMDKASVSRAVATLVERGLLAAEPDPADGRVQRLSLTPAGRRLHRSMAPSTLARHAAMLDALDPAERKAVFRILDKLIARLERLAADPPPRKAARR